MWRCGTGAPWGFGSCQIPGTVGHHSVTCVTWRPRGTWGERLRRFWLGEGAPNPRPRRPELGLILRRFHRYFVRQRAPRWRPPGPDGAKMAAPTGGPSQDGRQPAAAGSTLLGGARCAATNGSGCGGYRRFPSNGREGACACASCGVRRRPLGWGRGGGACPRRAWRSCTSSGSWWGPAASPSAASFASGGCTPAAPGSCWRGCARGRRRWTTPRRGTWPTGATPSMSTTPPRACKAGPSCTLRCGTRTPWGAASCWATASATSPAPRGATR